MKRYTYFDGGKWRLKIGDTEYSGDWVERLAAYEETGLEPEELAEWLEYEGGGACAEVYGWLDWLQQPAEEAR